MLLEDDWHLVTFVNIGSNCACSGTGLGLHGTKKFGTRYGKQDISCATNHFQVRGHALWSLGSDSCLCLRIPRMFEWLTRLI
jgi:hypothetical protein